MTTTRNDWVNLAPTNGFRIERMYYISHHLDPEGPRCTLTWAAWRGGAEGGGRIESLDVDEISDASAVLSQLEREADERDEEDAQTEYELELSRQTGGRI